MSDDALYKQAVENVKNLVDYVLNEYDVFAEKYDYDREWVRDRFRTEFNKRKKEIS